jgi:hypothetical protein
VEYGKSVYIESQGWAVFGRLGNEMQNSQLLTSLNSDWKEGPPLISDADAHKEGQCILQVYTFIPVDFFNYRIIIIINTFFCKMI